LSKESNRFQIKPLLNHGLGEHISYLVLDTAFPPDRAPFPGQMVCECLSKKKAMLVRDALDLFNRVKGVPVGGGRKWQKRTVRDKTEE
jgi:hypothetical protein